MSNDGKTGPEEHYKAEATAEQERIDIFYHLIRLTIESLPCHVTRSPRKFQEREVLVYTMRCG
jgi:hypothetical protein